MKHIEINGVALAQNPIHLLRLLLRVGVVMLVAPMVEPSRPVLSTHHGAAGAKLLQLGEFFFRLSGTEVNHGVKFGQSSGGQFIAAIGGVEQRFAEARALECGKNALQVNLVIAKRAVFVLDLHRQNWAAARDLQRRQFPAQALQPALGREQEFLVGAAQNHAGIGEKPRGEAAQVPLRAGIRARTQDDIQTFFLRRTDKSRDIGPSAEVVDSGLGFVHVPEYVRRNRVKAHGARFLEAIAPVLARDAFVMQFAGDDLQWLAVEHKVVAFDPDALRRSGNILRVRRRVRNGSENGGQYQRGDKTAKH